MASLSMSIMQFNADNGAITKIVNLENISDMSESQIKVSPNNQFVFINARLRREYFGMICRWNPEEVLILCREFEYLNIPAMIEIVSDTSLYSVLQNYNFLPEAYTDTYLTISDFTQDVSSLSLKIPCEKDQCMLFGCKGIFDESKNVIYNMININYDVLFFLLDVENKNISSKLLWSDFSKCGGVTAMKRFGNIIYSSFGCGDYMAITAYNVAQNNFLISYVGNSGMGSIAFTPHQIFFSYNTGNNAIPRTRLKRGPIGGMNSIFDIEFKNELNMVPPPIERDFDVVMNDTNPSYKVQSFTATEEDIPAVDDKMKPSSMFTIMSDLEFNLEPAILSTYINNNETIIDLDLT